MSVRSGAARAARPKPRLRLVVGWAVAIVVLVAMAISTKVVRIDSAAGTQTAGFSEEQFGASEFPKVQAGIEKRAVGADVLAAAIAKNQAAAVTRYSIPGGTGPEFSVKFTGVVGKGDFGSYPVTVPSLRKSLVINVQTGPAILGTDLRDATGTIAFGQFTNQIEYQNAGSALNKEMKKDVLAKIDTAHLSGKTVSVVGAFVLSDPNNWVVTPVELSVR